MLGTQVTQEDFDRQRKREANALSAGERAFRAQITRDAEQGNMARNEVGKLLVKRGIEPLEKAIETWFDEVNHRSIAKPAAYRWLKKIEPATAAYLALKVVLDGICKRREYTTICCQISDLLVGELRYRRLADQAPALFAYKLNHFNTSSYSHMARSMDHAVRTAKDAEGKEIDTSDLELTPHLRVHIGARLVDLLVCSTGLVVKDMATKIEGKKKQTTLFLEATEETHEWLTQRTEVLALLQPFNTPMVVPPLQWSAGQRGGYRFTQRGRYPFVRGVFDKKLRSEIEDRDSPLVYAAVNALQNTAWRINHAVYDLVRKIEQAGGGMAGIPLSDLIPLPPKPHDIDTNVVARKAWSKKAGAVREQNHMRKLQAREVQRMLATAQAVKEEAAIFFPYSVDFRGRVYPIADYLQPQGDDLAKALLTFAQGKPIDAEGARWLAIHGANCLGETAEHKVSKMTFEERIAWIHTNTKALVRVADDPLGDPWWVSADDPLQFYAFCVEWAQLIRANQKGEEYVCALPVSMDGSCNGLQHFSAMLRDEVGGRAVNVVPQTRPQDIYEHVAEAVLDKLELLAATDPLAVKLLGAKIVNRKLAKRPTMTFGYGSKLFGFKNQLKDYLQGLDNWQELKLLLTNGEKSEVGMACALLARLIWDSLGEVVVKAAEGMRWMQLCVRGIVQTGKAVEWIVPITSFKVKQGYNKWDRQQVQTVLAGSIIRPVILLHTDELDTVKQANAVSPNVIHSLDAAALMLTVAQAAAEGVESFAMIHDSYGALASDCDLLARCCRQSFVRLYTTEDVVSSLHRQFAAQHADPSKCPEPPCKGSLDVNAVLASDYFFA